jgi:hypothetical protein
LLTPLMLLKHLPILDSRIRLIKNRLLLFWKSWTISMHLTMHVGSF